MRDPVEERPMQEQKSMAERMQGDHGLPGGSLAEFLRMLKHYESTIPDAVAMYYISKNGISDPDPMVVKLFSIASQKFISDIALDAMQQARIKGLGQVSKGSKETRFTLTAELLKPILKEHGLDVDSI